MAMMTCHSWRCSTVFMLSKVHDGMTRLITSDRVCCPWVIMACHARRHPIVCPIKGAWWYSTPNIVQKYVLPNEDNVMPRATYYDQVCCLKAMWACNAQLHPILCVVQGRWSSPTMCSLQRRWWHATLEIIHFGVQYKGDDSIPCTTTSDRACCPMDMMTCHARSCLTVCAFQGLW